MGDLAFGKSFDMVLNGEPHLAMKLLHVGMLPLGMLAPVVWLIPVLAALPSLLQPRLAKDFLRFISWCSEQVDKRRRINPEVPDIASWLLTDLEKAEDPEEALKWLHGDSRLIIVAGSDTTAVTLTHVFYHLAVDPSLVEKLRGEIGELWLAGEEFNARNFQNADYLNGVIHETLRLHPPVASGVQRITPPEGITIDGTFVPSGVNVAVPNQSIGRCTSL